MNGYIYIRAHTHIYGYIYIYMDEWNMEKRRDTRIWDEILYPFDKLDASKSRG